MGLHFLTESQNHKSQAEEKKKEMVEEGSKSTGHSLIANIEIRDDSYDRLLHKQSCWLPVIPDRLTQFITRLIALELRTTNTAALIGINIHRFLRTSHPIPSCALIDLITLEDFIPQWF